MEGGMEGVQFANPGKVDSSKYIPNAIVVTDSDDDMIHKITSICINEYGQLVV